METPEIIYTTWGSKKSVTVKLNEEQYSQISYLFGKDGKPISKELDYNSKGYKWTLWIYRINTVYYLYGVSGDSTFGKVPWWFRQQYYGNIRAGREILGKFIEKYFINQEINYEVY